ncbi:MAG: hypothetical protein SGBAC_001511 [Bacillariaceae sp.]
MGKGFNKARNKQAQLAEKLNISKQQEGKLVEPRDDKKKSGDGNEPSQEDFQRLLDSTLWAMPTEDDSNSAFIPEIKVGKPKKKKVRKDPQAKIDAERAVAEKKRMEQEAKKRNNAQRRYFEPLVNVETNQALGVIDSAQLVPWVPPYLKDCLIVIVDPRPNSAELRQSIQYLGSVVEPNKEEEDKKSQRTIQDQVIFVTADSTKEAQAWLKRSKTESLIPIFSDPDLAWMNQYKATEGWCMSMMTFDTDGSIVENNANIQPSAVTQLVLDTLEIMSAEAT